MFLYLTSSTLLPTVACDTTTSPSDSLYRMVVLPALSRPTCSTQAGAALHEHGTGRTHAAAGSGLWAKGKEHWELTMTILYSLPLHHHPSSVEKTPPMACGLWSVGTATPQVRPT